MTEARVQDLLKVHEEIAAALRQACIEALAGPDNSWLDRLTALLQWHIRGEDELLLPEYEQRAHPVPPQGHPPGKPAEHTRILATLKALPALAGLDRLRSLRRLHHLLEHHDQREAQTFKPALDTLLPADLRARILATIESNRPSDPGLAETDAPDTAPIRAHWAGLLIRVEQTLAESVPESVAGAQRVLGRNRKLTLVARRVTAALETEMPLEAFDGMLTVETMLDRLA